MRLEGKVVVVTGGSQGIGEALARRYAREGAGVAILNREHSAGEAVASSIRDDGGTAVAIACDVSVVPALGAAVAAVHDALGPIDVLVNNAGAFVMTPLGGSDEAGFDLMIGANLKGLFFLSQEVLPDFEAAGRGKIINIGSIFGNDGFPESAIYCATKSAVHMITKVLALDLRERNIQVNAIAPGFIETPLNAGFRATNADYRRRADERFGGPGVWMQADELTGAAVFLASEDADSVTGATLLRRTGAGRPTEAPPRGAARDGPRHASTWACSSPAKAAKLAGSMTWNLARTSSACSTASRWTSACAGPKSWTTPSRSAQSAAARSGPTPRYSTASRT